MGKRIGICVFIFVLGFSAPVMSCEDKILYVYDDFSSPIQDDKWEITQSFAETIDPPSSWKIINNNGVWEIKGFGANLINDQVIFIPSYFSYQVRSMKIDFRFSSDSDNNSRISLFTVPYLSSGNYPVFVEAVLQKFNDKAYFGAYSQYPIGASDEYFINLYCEWEDEIELDTWYSFHICSDASGNIFIELSEKDGQVIRTISDDISLYLGETPPKQASLSTSILISPPPRSGYGKVRVDMDNVYIDHKISYYSEEDMENAYDDGYSDGLSSSDCSGSQDQCISIDETFDLALPCVSVGEKKFRVNLDYYTEGKVWRLGEISELEEEVE